MYYVQWAAVVRRAMDAVDDGRRPRFTPTRPPRPRSKLRRYASALGPPIAGNYVHYPPLQLIVKCPIASIIITSLTIVIKSFSMHTLFDSTHRVHDLQSERLSASLSHSCIVDSFFISSLNQRLASPLSSLSLPQQGPLSTCRPFKEPSP